MVWPSLAPQPPLRSKTHSARPLGSTFGMKSVIQLPGDLCAASFCATAGCEAESFVGRFGLVTAAFPAGAVAAPDGADPLAGLGATVVAGVVMAAGFLAEVVTTGAAAGVAVAAASVGVGLAEVFGDAAVRIELASTPTAGFANCRLLAPAALSTDRAPAEECAAVVTTSAMTATRVAVGRRRR